MTLAVLLLMAVPPARQLWREQAQVQAAERKLEALKRDNARLDRHLARLEDPDYLEQLARQELGLVRPGEIGFVVVPGEAAARKDATPARPDPWYERIWRSLRGAVGAG
jgi:cell division protein FtsB